MGVTGASQEVAREEWEINNHALKDGLERLLLDGVNYALRDGREYYVRVCQLHVNYENDKVMLRQEVIVALVHWQECEVWEYTTGMLAVNEGAIPVLAARVTTPTGRVFEMHKQHDSVFSLWERVE